MIDEDIGLWNELLHEKLMGLLREYQMVGGMPEAVQAFLSKGLRGHASGSHCP